METKTKEKRLPCPFCKELIIDGAKKCRFCGEVLEPLAKIGEKKGFLKKEISVKLFYWIWLTMCSIFLVSIKLFDTANSQFISSQIYRHIQNIFVLAIFIGSGAFIGLVIAILFSLKKKESRVYGLLTTGTLILFFLFFLNHISQAESVSSKDPLGPVEVIQSINKERESRGLETLATEIKLNSAAKAYAQDMCDKNYFPKSDEASDKYLEFVDNTGYQYNVVAYTLIEGVYDTDLLMEQWLGNPQIKEIIVSDRYSATGVGIVRCGLEVLGKTTDIVVQFYAEPASSEIKKQNFENTSNSNSDLIECIGPDNKQFMTSMEECKILNEKWGKSVDYMTNCNISENCGGGTTPLKQSECDNSICCQIGNEWIFYKDKSKCEKDQSSGNGYYVGQYQSSVNQPNPLSVSEPPGYTEEELEYLRSQMVVKLNQCIGEASRKYQNAKTAAGNKARALGYTSINYQGLQDQFDRDVAYCNSLYK